MKIIISAESTIDLSPELLKKYHISTIPFTVNLGERMGKDGEITPEDIFQYVDETGELPKTSAINEFEYSHYFKDLLKQYDAIIHISLSEKISSAILSARKAASKLENVYVIDSRSLSTGIALSAIYASQLVDKGYSPKEIVKKVESRTHKVQASFVVNTLSYLYKGGRCTGLQKFGAMLLRLKPQIVLKHGAMVPGKKYRGKSINCVDEYCRDTLGEFNNPDKSIVFITHTHATEEMVENCREWLKHEGFVNILETIAGATITSHCGPKTIGILYINDGGVKD
ncbi:MAG: DegV family protein [Bacilli bacterium]|nr:DegV family protein [Bacilli bacterium]